MFCPSEKEFLSLSKKGNIIPVFKEIYADTDTPVSAFLKACQGKYSFLLESVETAESIGRYSFLGSEPRLVLKTKNKVMEIITAKGSKRIIIEKDPLEEIKKIMQQFKFVNIKGLPRFCGGLVGYIGYDTVRFFENLPKTNPDDLNLPDCLFMLTDSLIIFDHYKHRISIVSNVHISENRVNLKQLYAKALAKIEKIETELRKSIFIPHLEFKQGKGNQLVSNFSKTDFKKAVLDAKQYIKDGEIIQVVLSQRFRVKTQARSFDVYRNLRSINPSPYMYYLKFDNLNIIGSSPEMLVRCEEGLAETRPIAGTRPRGKDAAEDTKLMKDLLADRKERAEHIMLVDLGRNDLGRVCKFNSVKIKGFMSIELYSHVMHIVSSVVGKLRKNKDIYDLLRSCFPAGTVTGAPKVRAMQIIDELEPVLRGPYAGCVGYFGFSGNLDTCITIRTIVMKGNSAYIQAGAGLVYDSKPENEFQETCNKAKAALKALGV